MRNSWLNGAAWMAGSSPAMTKKGRKGGSAFDRKHRRNNVRFTKFGNYAIHLSLGLDGNLPCADARRRGRLDRTKIGETRAGRIFLFKSAVTH